MWVLEKDADFQLEIKRSRFIAKCTPITSPSDVPTAIIRLHEPDATHNCWAWVSGQEYRFFDDGEPSGSAGKPMLAAISAQNFDNVLALVVRYFGGIKLGVGGLVRAYGGIVANCLQNAPKHEFVAMTNLQFQVDFQDLHAVYGIIRQQNLLKTAEHFSSEGVSFELSISISAKDAICILLRDATGARVRYPDSCTIT
jgi:uncharacterized YigZ family protein